MTYKQYIQQVLQRNNWEITEIGSGLFWWDLEHWKIRRYAQAELVVCFMADPFDEVHVQHVRLCTQFPAHWDEQGIVSISLNDGLFNEQLNLFEAKLIQLK